MKKLIAVGALLVAALGVAGTADAGVEAVDANGNYLVIDADFNPAASSTGTTRTAAIFNIDVSSGNKRTGDPFPSTEKLSLAYPRGTKYNGRLFPKCPAPTAETLATERCPANTKIGDGGAVVDARRLGVQEPIVGTLTAYNGALRDGNPTVHIIGESTLNGQPVRQELDFVWTRGRLETFLTEGSNPAGTSFSSFNLDSGRLLTRRVSGRRVRTSLWETPRTCPARGWTFSLTATFPAESGLGPIAAPDRQSCVQVR